MNDPMTEAARLARESVERGEGGPFGAVIVNEGRIVGAAGNRVVKRKDPTAHAEVEAIREACRALDRIHLDGCEIFTTCEPCPMCLAAIHWARIERVRYALTREDAERIGFHDAFIHEAMQAPTVEMVRVESAAAEEAFRLYESLPDPPRY